MVAVIVVAAVIVAGTVVSVVVAGTVVRLVGAIVVAKALIIAGLVGASFIALFGCAERLPYTRAFGFLFVRIRVHGDELWLCAVEL